MTSFEKQKLIDKDGRTSDFTHAEFIQGSKEFKAAFSKDAFSMIWGCNVNSTALEIVLAISKDLEYIPGNSDMIKFRGKKMKIDSFRVSGDTVNINGFDKTIQELTDLLEKMLDGGYALALAKASGKIAEGALLSTSSLSDAKHQDFKTKLMHLPFGRPPDSKNENFGPVLKFYKYIFNAEFAKDIISKDIAPYIIEGDPEFRPGKRGGAGARHRRVQCRPVEPREPVGADTGGVQDRLKQHRLQVQRLQRHVLQPEIVGQTPGVVER